MDVPVARLIVDLLAAAGVREVFSVAGGALTPLLGALAAQDPAGGEIVRYVGVRHEFAAATMAAAVHHGTGRLAVCLGEQGPGTLNLVSGLGVARNNNLALLALTVSGDSRTARPGSGALMELDAVALSAPVTKWRHGVRNVAEIPAVIDEAVRQATTGRPGPVHVDIPRDVIAQSLPALPAPFPAPVAPPAPDEELVAEAAALLAAAERPLVIAGGGAVGASEVLRTVAGHLGAATTCTQMGIGVLSSDGVTFAGHGGVIGGPGVVRAASEADVVLAVGCRFSSWLWRDGRPLTRTARVVRIDVDPAAFDTAPPETVGLLGDAATVLDMLWTALERTPARPAGPWVHDVHAELVAHRSRIDALAADPAHPAALARGVADLLDPSDLVVLDGGHTTFWSNDATPAREPRRVFHEPGMGHLGFGVPYANALALTHPDRRVVTVTGDGAFGFSLVELDTARRLGLRTITVVADNARWGVIGLAQGRAGFSLGTELAGTDYAAIATGFGCLGIRVEDIADLPAAWAKAVASEMPAVLDVVVRFEPHPMMPAFGRTTAVPS